MIVLQAAQEKIRFLRFSPDGRRLVAPFSGGVQVWHHPFGGPPTHVLNQQGVNSARFAPDGQKLLLCGPPVVFIDLSSREVTPVPLELGTRPAFCDLSPDGQFLVVAQVPRPDSPTAGGLNAWLEVTARLFCRSVADLGCSLWSVLASGRVTDPPLFLPGRERFVALERRHEGKIVTRDLGTGAVLAEAHLGSAGVFDNPVMSPDGRLIACHRGVQIAVYRLEALAADPVMFMNDTTKQFTGVAFHPSGRYLAATSNDATVKLYDTATWKAVQTFDWCIGRLRSVVFSPDGMLAAAGGDEGRITVWDVDL